MGPVFIYDKYSVTDYSYNAEISNAAHRDRKLLVGKVLRLCPAKYN